MRVFELHVEGEEHSFIFDDLENFLQRLAEIEEVGQGDKVIIQTLEMDSAKFVDLQEVHV